ncbi:MAG: ABC transporter substrate-binding protein [Peptostreptococcaceae bacterium]|nr:ABC transporter substrate-binding protein [Peptostreptococcaceae bacterium]
MIFILLLVGCSQSGSVDQSQPTTNPPAENQQQNETKQTRIVVDQTGESVEVPTEINRVVIAFQPFGSIYPLFVGSADSVVGTLPGSLDAAEYSLLSKAYPKILEVDTSFYQNDEINVESVLNLKPDLVLYMAGDEKQKQAYKDAGIPALGFRVDAGDFNTVETYNGWIKILGEAFGMEDKAKEIIEYTTKDYEEIQKRLSALKPEDKKKVLILNGYSASNMITSGGKQFPHFWAIGSGGINVAEGAFTGNKPINMEQVYEWQPDIIYLSTFSPYEPQDLINNQAKEGDDWSNINAVKNGRVYKYPLGMFRWYPPNSESILSLWWMSQNNYPELFSDFDLKAKVKDYYSRFYSYELTDEEYEQIFRPDSRASGLSK